MLTTNEGIDPRLRNKILLGGGALALVLWLLWQAGTGLLPFIFALLIVYLLTPLIDLLGRFVPRTVAILLVYLVLLGVLAGLLWLIVPAAAGQVRDLIKNWPRYVEELRQATRDLQAWYAGLDLSPEQRAELENRLRQAGGTMGDLVQSLLSGTLSFVTRTLSLIFGFVIIPFWLFYVLKDKEILAGGVFRMVPEPLRVDTHNVLGIVKGVLDEYIRGQAILGLTVGTATTLGLWFVGAPYWLLLGVLYGFTEVIPVLGPIIGAIPGILVALLTGDWGMVLKVLAVYLVVQQLENNILVPRIQGEGLDLHPAVIILVLIVAGQVAGFWGVFLGVPLAAISRDVYQYIYRRLGDGLTPPEARASLSKQAKAERAPGEAVSQPGATPPPAGEPG